MRLTLVLLLSLILNVSLNAEVRIGIIGCDTSHVPAFTETLNNPQAKGHVEGAKIVAAYKGGSDDIPESANRVNGYAKTLTEKYGVKMYDSIEEMCTNVDAVLIESLDGRPKLQQLKAVVAAKKPVFVDKPMAASLHDVIEMFAMARRAKVPIFSSSSLRFASNTVAVHNGLIGTVTNAETYGPCELEPHHPDLFWYGIHGVESLYAVMGTGCAMVQRTNTPDGKIQVTGTWGRGRKGTFRQGDFHGMARGAKGEAPVGSFDGYVPLVKEIITFFQTRVEPVDPKETIEIFAFMEAADLSKARGGKPVKIGEVMARAARSK
jgi:predicted dehydrogenase